MLQTYKGSCLANFFYKNASASCCSGIIVSIHDLSYGYNYTCNCLVLKVMSESVACALEVLDGDSTQQTRVFIRMIDRFF